MVKKMLLPLLMAAIAMPQSASALVLPSGTHHTSGMVATQNSLSVSDRQAIKKLLDTLEKSANQGDLKTFLSLYSKKYLGSTKGGTRTNYQELKSGLRAAVAVMKAYGIQIAIKNIKITESQGNRAKVSSQYQFTLDPDVLAEMNEKQRKQLQNMVVYSVATVEKENGRWVIIAESTSQPKRSTSAIRGAKPVSIKNQQQERKALQALFKKHLQALNKEDLNSYLATLDPDSAQYAQAQAQTTQLFKEYDLKYEIQMIEVISIGKKDAVVKLIATVKKLKGGNFANSKMVTYNTIRKTTNGWRIADTQVESISALQASR